MTIADRFIGRFRFGSVPFVSPRREGGGTRTPNSINRACYNNNINVVASHTHTAEHTQTAQYRNEYLPTFLFFENNIL